MSKKILIVGGVAGGVTAISRLRRLDENAQIILFEKNEHVSFANCGLPYYIRGASKEREALFVTTKEAIESKYNVEIRNFSEVIKVNPDTNSITVKNLNTNEVYEESCDKLLLSTGSSPFIPPMEGKDFNNVFTLWNIPDTDKIYNYIKDNNVKNAVVVGGGFIGVEMAENLVERGINVTLVEFANQILAPLDPDMSKLAENQLQEKGIQLMLNAKVDKIVDNGKQVLLADGTAINTELTLLSIGIRANTNFLKDSGINLNQRGGVIVDEYMQTNIENIYAIGDMIETTNLINNQKTMIPLAGIANKQGRAVAANILGQTPETFDEQLERVF